MFIDIRNPILVSFLGGLPLMYANIFKFVYLRVRHSSENTAAWLSFDLLLFPR